MSSRRNFVPEPTVVSPSSSFADENGLPPPMVSSAGSVLPPPGQPPQVRQGTKCHSSGELGDEKCCCGEHFLPTRLMAHTQHAQLHYCPY